MKQLRSFLIFAECYLSFVLDNLNELNRITCGIVGSYWDAAVSNIAGTVPLVYQILLSNTWIRRLILFDRQRLLVKPKVSTKVIRKNYHVII